MNLSIGIVGITLAVSPKQRRTDSRYLEEVHNHSRITQISHQQVALGVDIGCNVVGHLPGVVAQSDPAVERYRAEPDRTTVSPLVQNLPESDMMSSVGASAVGLLERELLLFPLVVERADGRIMVWPVKHDAANDLDA
jgi:hypothetical protein